jgi:hypothetical protein
MTFARTLFLGAAVWTAGITLAYVALNWEPASAGKFKVGFLPVT